MSAAPKVNWEGDLAFEFIEMKKAGKSHADVAAFIYSKYGVSYTIGRISQIYKKFKQEGRL
jgi:hypothetical protein